MQQPFLQPAQSLPELKRRNAAAKLAAQLHIKHKKGLHNDVPIRCDGCCNHPLCSAAKVLQSEHPALDFFSARNLLVEHDNYHTFQEHVKVQWLC